MKAQVDLAEQGYDILIPLSEHAAFDFVAYREGCCKRVQVNDDLRRVDQLAGRDIFEQSDGRDQAGD